MNFIELRPSRVVTQQYTGDKVRVGFTQITPRTGNAYTVMSLYIGKDCARKLDIVHGDRLKLEIDEGNPLIWHLTKSETEGFKVMDTIINKSTPNKVFKIQVSWGDRIPGLKLPQWIGTKYVSIDFRAGGLRVFLPGVLPQDMLL